MFPIGYDAIVGEYNNPKLYLRTDGSIHYSWEQMILAPCVLPEPLALGWDPTTKIARVRCHFKIAGPLGLVFDEIHKNGHWPLLKTYDGCYAWRTQRGATQKLSTHCWGIAIDFNANTNQLGADGDMAPEIVQAFKKFGWTWGGDFQRRDCMHFQACSGY